MAWYDKYLEETLVACRGQVWFTFSVFVYMDWGKRIKHQSCRWWF